MKSRSSYIRTETIISICINTVLSLGFVFFVFHGQARIPVLGAHGIVSDLVPQTFMVTLMGCLIPGLLTRKRLLAGDLAWLDHGLEIGVGQVVVTAFIAAIVVTVVIVGICWTLLPHVIAGGLSFGHLVIAKVIFGASLAAFMTPWAIRRLLRSR